MIHFSCEKFSDRDVRKLADILSKCIDITQIDLDFGRYHRNNSWEIFLIVTIKRCKEITDGGLQKLSTSFKKFKNLESLTFKLWGYYLMMLGSNLIFIIDVVVLQKKVLEN